MYRSTSLNLESEYCSYGIIEKYHREIIIQRKKIFISLSKQGICMYKMPTVEKINRQTSETNSDFIIAQLL